MSSISSSIPSNTKPTFLTTINGALSNLSLAMNDTNTWIVELLDYEDNDLKGNMIDIIVLTMLFGMISPSRQVSLHSNFDLTSLPGLFTVLAANAAYVLLYVQYGQ